jgi:copper chaperone NosL
VNAIRRAAGMAALLIATACGPSGSHPAPLDTRNETCGFCRMPVSDPRLAAQIAAPGEEPAFFDDIGCLRDYVNLKQAAARPRGAVAFVTDHRTGEWVRAARAVYARCAGVETPMGSHLVAHADPASRGGDTAARACEPMPIREIFGPSGPPDERE